MLRRCGVAVLTHQQDLFDINAEQIEKMRRLDEVIDRINRLNGSETIVIGAQQYTQKNGKGKANVFANAIKHDFESPNPTTGFVVPPTGEISDSVLLFFAQCLIYAGSISV
jgi:hypothetical protein